MNTHVHPIPAVYDEHSRILVLGSFPSVRSRETGFYYGHPNNRFWRVIGSIFGEQIPQTVTDKTNLLLSNHIALWDAIAECDIIGSADSSIRNVVPNDLTPILDCACVKAIFTNGRTADSLYRRYLRSKCGIDAIPLPSTSPANVAYSLDRLIGEWKIIREFI